METFVDRDEAGKIKGVYAIPQRQGHEKLQQEDQEVQAYLNPPPITVKTEGSTDWSIIALWIAVGVLAVKVGLDPKVVRSESEAQAREGP